MSERATDESLEFLDQVQARAEHALEQDWVDLRREFSDEGAAGDLVRAHPLLALGGASTAGVGLALIVRAVLRGSRRAVGGALGLLTLPLAHEHGPRLARRALRALLHRHTE